MMRDFQASLTARKSILSDPVGNTRYSPFHSESRFYIGLELAAPRTNWRFLVMRIVRLPGISFLTFYYLREALINER